MYNNLIKKYLNILTKEDIKKYSLKNNIILSDSEIDILYDTLKNNNNIDLLLSNNYDVVFKKIEPYLNNKNYVKIKNIFLEYKNKFKI
ncbi:MAG: hypothetical protein ACI4OT_00025 [Bacilli bacterium]